MAVGTTRGKRRLGRYIRPILERSGRSREEVAERAVCSVQTVGRLVTGESLPALNRLNAILLAMGASDEERAHALALWQVADADTAAIAHADAMPAKYRRFRMDEAEAIKERSLDTVIIPGLLQTSNYAAAVARGRRELDQSGQWDAHAAAERADRAALLTKARNPLVLHALIDEAALRRVIGGPDVMAEQLDHLLTMGALPHVTIQVIPFDFGAYGAMSGPLTLLTFPEQDELDAAYTESVTGADTVGKIEDVAALAKVWQDVADSAPSPDRSAEMIKQARDAVLDEH